MEFCVTKEVGIVLRNVHELMSGGGRRWGLMGTKWTPLRESKTFELLLGGPNIEVFH